LKPANFLQGEDGSLRLTDFGLAKARGEEAAAEPAADVGLTQTGVGMGTPLYMAPEQFDDAKHADERADVYSLGVMLFYALTGEPPYPGPSATKVMSQQIRVRAGNEPAPRARRLRPEIPQALDDLCARALELDREKRTIAASSFVDALSSGAVDT